MSLPIEARKYLKVLVEQSLLQFFVVVRVRENKQLFIKVSCAIPPPSPHLTTTLHASTRFTTSSWVFRSWRWTVHLW